jgi:hypothetical protein
VTAIFEIKDLENGEKHIGSFVNLLKSEGMEILSLETRSLDIQEAMFIKNRKVQEQDQEVAALVNKGFDMDHRRKSAITPSAAFKAVTRNDLATLDKICMDTEQSIRRKTTRLDKGKNSKLQNGGKENQNTNSAPIVKNQTTFLRDDFSSDEEGQERMTTSINPRPPFKGPKVTNSLTKKPTRLTDKKIVELKPYGVE